MQFCTASSCLLIHAAHDISDQNPAQSHISVFTHTYTVRGVDKRINIVIKPPRASQILIKSV